LRHKNQFESCETQRVTKEILRADLIKNTYVDQILLAKNVVGRNESSISFLFDDLFVFKCSVSEKAREYPILIIKTYL